MEQEKFKELADCWYAATQKVLALESPEVDVISKLYEATYFLIKEYGSEKLIPREICKVLWEMNDFSWWVCSVGEDTSLYSHYQEIISLTTALNGYISTGRADEMDVRYNIEKLSGNV